MGTAAKLVGTLMLVGTGCYGIWKGRHEDSHPEDIGPFRFSYLLLTALALSIDNLVVGFALSLTDVAILLAAGVIALVSVGMSLAGLEFGQRLGKRFEQWSDELGGGALILVRVALGLGLFR